MVIIVFGVSGSGKTTIGQLLARQLGWSFYDADDFHSKANVEKMRQGIPLTEDDRTPWLESLRKLIETNLQQNKSIVLACSALKESYRQLLSVNDAVKWVYLKGSFELIETRLAQRVGHYMSPSLLRSQFSTLEMPLRKVTEADISLPPEGVVQSIREQLGV